MKSRFLQLDLERTKNSAVSRGKGRQASVRTAQFVSLLDSFLDHFEG